MSLRQLLEEAQKLNKKMPDDVMVWGFLTDANVELGNYKDAENAAQWMLNLRPGNLPALTRAAYLRELFGDPEGALELMQMALDSTPPSEVEDRAWITTQMAHLKLAEGKTEQAEESAAAGADDVSGISLCAGKSGESENSAETIRRCGHLAATTI